ncbi:ribose ABC transporter permease, partial [Klebsiella oxytoca]|nr:ribose ABC transporter permease [Klebsiella oxytoca]
LLSVPFFTQLLIKGIVIILAVAIDGLKQHPELFTFWRKKEIARTR